ncbi:MAG: N-acetyl-alpha-D-glucosaminyl L-malate synthase BshA [Gemmatimonadota bacterium]|nr:N-acetyl-alpha-D-glucosaminyl L-malate synthase BshA [Gemmatimonadota bacterium]MDH5804373.1 N-acetyl-alpha-D-glucosaminyl L-malate synthase BshA [Gemmatimonadota bacterium]
MKIGITCYPTYGGSGAVATELGLELAKRGHEIHVISYASPFRMPGFAENVYFHAVDVSAAYPLLEYFPYSLALAVKQHEVALREQLDVLHVHYAVPHATAGFLAREMLREDHRMPLATTLHGTDITLVGQEQSFFTVTKFAIEQSDAVTAVSRYLQEETFQKFGCERSKIEVIPNFIDRTVYVPSDDCKARKALARPDEKIILHTSNFRPLKQVPALVRVFAKIEKEVPSVLVLVGDGPDRTEAEKTVQELGLDDKVRFLGKLNTVVDVLQAGDLFMLPSSSEAFGLGALEAMSCGLPVVASNVGGVPEVVEDGVSGFLHPPDDLDGMAHSAIELLKDDALYEKVSRGAIARAETFSVDRVVPMYENMYERLMRG